MITNSLFSNDENKIAAKRIYPHLRFLKDHFLYEALFTSFSLITHLEPAAESWKISLGIVQSKAKGVTGLGLPFPFLEC